LETVMFEGSAFLRSSGCIAVGVESKVLSDCDGWSVGATCVGVEIGATGLSVEHAVAIAAAAKAADRVTR
jgi:hypothetical protein